MASLGYNSILHAKLINEKERSRQKREDDAVMFQRKQLENTQMQQAFNQVLQGQSQYLQQQQALDSQSLKIAQAKHTQDLGLRESLRKEEEQKRQFGVSQEQSATQHKETIAGARDRAHIQARGMVDAEKGKQDAVYVNEMLKKRNSLRAQVAKGISSLESRKSAYMSKANYEKVMFSFEDDAKLNKYYDLRDRLNQVTSKNLGQEMYNMDTISREITGVAKGNEKEARGSIYFPEAETGSALANAPIDLKSEGQWNDPNVVTFTEPVGN